MISDTGYWLGIDPRILLFIFIVSLTLPISIILNLKKYKRKKAGKKLSKKQKREQKAKKKYDNQMENRDL